LDLLKFIPRKSAALIAKTLQSAIANAENNHDLSADALTVDRAIIEMGPSLKRFKAAARGGVAKRRKRMSHIRIVLTDNA
jgi:large subunit ribosomal protein L22